MNNRDGRTSQKPIRILPGENGRIIVHLPYTPTRLEKIKTIPGRRWDPDVKCWNIPHVDGIVEELLSLFKGEQVEVDPSLLLPTSQRSSESSEPRQSGVLMEMAQELRLKGYRFKTRKAYLGHVERFIRFHQKDPKSLGETEARAYVYELLESGKSHSYVNQCVSALRFFMQNILGNTSAVERLPRPKKERKLPNILSGEEVSRLLEAVTNPKHRAIMLLTYAGGLRLGEVVRLKVG